jgi:hypothetical protein
MEFNILVLIFQLVDFLLKIVWMGVWAEKSEDNIVVNPKSTI